MTENISEFFNGLTTGRNNLKEDILVLTRIKSVLSQYTTSERFQDMVRLPLNEKKDLACFAGLSAFQMIFVVEKAKMYLDAVEGKKERCIKQSETRLMRVPFQHTRA